MSRREKVAEVIEEFIKKTDVGGGNSHSVLIREKIELMYVYKVC